MVFAHRPTSLPLALIATLMVHGMLLLIQSSPGALEVSREEIAPIQLTTIRSDVPFVAGKPSATVPKAKVRPQAAAPMAQMTPETTPPVAAESAPSSGQGGTLSTVSAAGARATGDLRAIYLSELRARLEEVKHYPLQARRLGQTGSVEVAFKVRPDGSIEDARIIRPSPFNRLNESALATVEALKKFRPLPESFGSDPLSVTLPIRYSIRN